MRGNWDSIYFLQHGGQFGGETISTGLGVKGAPRNLVV